MHPVHSIRRSTLIYAAALLGPLFLLWGVLERFLRKVAPRRGDPFRDSNR